MLDISLGLIILTAVVFFILVFLLNSWLYRPLLRFMNERDGMIRRDLENAMSNEEGSQKVLEEAKAIIMHAKQEASAMKKEALEKLKAQMQEMVASKKAELEKRYEAFEKELVEEEKEIKSALISQMPLFKEALKAKFNTL